DPGTAIPTARAAAQTARTVASHLRAKCAARIELRAARSGRRSRVRIVAARGAGPRVHPPRTASPRAPGASGHGDGWHRSRRLRARAGRDRVGRPTPTRARPGAKTELFPRAGGVEAQTPGRRPW